MEKRFLANWQIWSMSFGLLGINFGWGLQMANMSAIYEFLGAKPDQIPILWLAAPLTGLLVQPLIGWMSDRTWCWLGRRSPYFLIGALLSSVALLLMPLSHNLWMAASLLWILDASVNISMGPFRALVPDILPLAQQTKGFMVQGILIASGTVLASALPWTLQHVFAVSTQSMLGKIPILVTLSFWIGAVIFISAILWTLFTTREIPPNPLNNAIHDKLSLKTLLHDFCAMPRAMRDLAWVMMFSWMGLFCMFLYFPVSVTHRIFHGVPGSVAYAQGLAFAGLCFAAYGVFFLITSLLLPAFARYCTKKSIHCFCLLCGGFALTAMSFVQAQWQLLAMMLGVGIAFASMQSMPYAMLSEHLPRHKLGIYMGFFNLFIVIPEIIVSLGFGWFIKYCLGGHRYLAVAAGGICMLLAAIFTLRIKETTIVYEPLEKPMVA